MIVGLPLTIIRCDGSPNKAIQALLSKYWINAHIIICCRVLHFRHCVAPGHPRLPLPGEASLGLVDDETVARFRSDNRQYIRQGILAENSKVYLFLIIDYARPDASRSRAPRSR